MSIQVNPRPSSISNILKGNHPCYVAPSFQREYEWGTKKDLDKPLSLFNTILGYADEDVGEEESNLPLFLGTITTYKPENSAFVKAIIDGQQRLATIWLLLYAIWLESDPTAGGLLSKDVLEQCSGPNASKYDADVHGKIHDELKGMLFCSIDNTKLFHGIVSAVPDYYWLLSRRDWLANFENKDTGVSPIKVPTVVPKFKPNKIIPIAHTPQNDYLPRFTRDRDNRLKPNKPAGKYDGYALVLSRFQELISERADTPDKAIDLIGRLQYAINHQNVLIEAELTDTANLGITPEAAIAHFNRVNQGSKLLKPSDLCIQYLEGNTQLAKQLTALIADAPVTVPTILDAIDAITVINKPEFGSNEQPSSTRAGNYLLKNATEAKTWLEHCTRLISKKEGKGVMPLGVGASTGLLVVGLLAQKMYSSYYEKHKDATPGATSLHDLMHWVRCLNFWVVTNAQSKNITKNVLRAVYSNAVRGVLVSALAGDEKPEIATQKLITHVWSMLSNQSMSDSAGSAKPKVKDSLFGTRWEVPLGKDIVYALWAIESQLRINNGVPFEAAISAVPDLCSSGDLARNFGGIEVEHFIPQSGSRTDARYSCLSPKAIKSIGNLTLTTKKTNVTLSDRSIDEKLNGLTKTARSHGDATYDLFITETFNNFSSIPFSCEHVDAAISARTKELLDALLKFHTSNIPETLFKSKES